MSKITDRDVPIMYLYRGLPGSGKSSAASKHGCIVISPSDYSSYRAGKYRWVRGNYMINKMVWRAIVELIMTLQIDLCIAELMPEAKHINFWLKVARKYQYEVRIRTLIVDVETACKRNVHQADHQSIQEVHDQFDYTIEDQTIDFSDIENGPLLQPYNRKPPVDVYALGYISRADMEKIQKHPVGGTGEEGGENVIDKVTNFTLRLK